MNHTNRNALFFSLNTLLRQLLRNDIELPRVARTACLLLLGGSSTNSMPQAVENRILTEQHDDGGWVGPDDTMWCLLYLKLIGKGQKAEFQRGISYLRSNFQNRIGWGRSSRDIPRIPVTGRILHFLPELCEPEAFNGLLSLWNKEQNSLTYKAASVLMACSSSPFPIQKSIVLDAWDWLRHQQNPDGGFGPWLNHPAGSDVYCTAYSMLGLLSCVRTIPAPFNTINAASDWMARTQLDIGLWGYHQIEDGAAWGWYALNEVAKFGGPKHD